MAPPTVQPVTRLFTFGYGQTCQFTGKDLGDHYALVTAPDRGAALLLMCATFPNNWAFEYDPESPSIVDYVPRMKLHARLVIGLTPADPEPEPEPEFASRELLAVVPSADGGVAFAMAPVGAVVDPVARAKAVELTEAVAADPTGLNYGRGDEGTDPQPAAGRVPPHFESGRDEVDAAVVMVPVVDLPMRDEQPRGAPCPSCDSPEPRLHPATQAEGEVTALCGDRFHASAK